jgi:hypothetical protein
VRPSQALLTLVVVTVLDLDDLVDLHAGRSTRRATADAIPSARW